MPADGAVNGGNLLGSSGLLGSDSGPCSRLHVVKIILPVPSLCAAPDHFRDLTKLIGAAVNSSNFSKCSASFRWLLTRGALPFPVPLLLARLARSLRRWLALALPHPFRAP